MKIDNQSFGFDNASCGALENPLFASSAAGWRRGYAADCKSVRQISHLRLVYKAENATVKLDKTPGHSANEGETLTTPAWWIAPFIALGFVVWLRILGVV